MECNRLMVSALITNNSGMVVGYLSDAVSYDNGSNTWLFIGNGLLSDFNLYHAAYITYGLDGNPTTAPASLECLCLSIRCPLPTHLALLIPICTA